MILFCTLSGYLGGHSTFSRLRWSRYCQSLVYTGPISCRSQRCHLDGSELLSILWGKERKKKQHILNNSK